MQRAERLGAALAVVVAVVRGWGLGAALVAALALCVVGSLAGDVYVDLPFLGDRTIILHLLPVLTGMALGFPLVDRTPELTLLAPGSLRLPVLRLVGTLVVALPVLGTLLAAGWTAPGASVVLGMLGITALSAAVLGLWYWVPFFGVVVAWVQGRSPMDAAGAGAGWLAASLGALALGGAAYLVLSTLRVRRQVRASRRGSGPQRSRMIR